MPSSPPAKRAKAVEGASVPPSLHPLDASLEERRVLSGLPVVYTLLCDLCLPETKRADAAGSHDARRDDEPVVDLAQAMASKAPVEQRAAQALRMLARIKEDLTLRLVAILYACPRLPVQSGAALPLALVLSPRSVEHSSRVWSDVAKCGEGFLEKLESFWREWTTAVERTARDHPGDRSAGTDAVLRLLLPASSLVNLFETPSSSSLYILHMLSVCHLPDMSWLELRTHLSAPRETKTCVCSSVERLAGCVCAAPMMSVFFSCLSH